MWEWDFRQSMENTQEIVVEQWIIYSETYRCLIDIDICLELLAMKKDSFKHFLIKTGRSSLFLKDTFLQTPARLPAQVLLLKTFYGIIMSRLKKWAQKVFNQQYTGRPV